MSQPGAAEATQELSQDWFEGVIEERRSVHTRNHLETQGTLIEDDEGHVDLMSSYKQRQEPDSEPVDYSPSQVYTQVQLDRFPESQRFKTPATIGKKRDYNGNTRETPTLPRAPVLRSGGRSTPGNAMGLTQAFADTQAATSPFVDDVPRIVSDLPSPDIDIQQRPSTANASPTLKRMTSPLLISSGSRRAVTEPLSNYKPRDISQAERNERHAQGLAEDSSDNDSDSSFGADSQPYTDHHRRHLRLSRITREMRSGRPLAMAESMTTPAPCVEPLCRERTLQTASNAGLTPCTTRSTFRQTSPAKVEDQEEDAASEAETEQEEQDPMLQQSSLRRPADPEDKENVNESSVQIPRTNLRHTRLRDAHIVEEQGSPLVNRHHTQQRESLDQIAVVNSQPSQQPPTSQHLRPKSTLNSGPEFVPQSQVNQGQHSTSSGHSRRIPDSSKPPVPSPPDSQCGSDIGEDGDGDGEVPRLRYVHTANVSVDHQPVHGDELSHSSKAKPESVADPVEDVAGSVLKPRKNESIRASAIAETSSNGKLSVAAYGPSLTEECDSRNNSKFETAPTHLPAPSSSAIGSSPPIMTPRQKRKRIAEIANEPSPSQQGLSVSFDAGEALGLAADTEDLLDESPVRPRKRPRVLSAYVEIDETAPSLPRKQVQPTSSAVSLVASDDLLASQPAVRQTRARGRLSPKQNERPLTSLTDRQGTWDIGVTPSPQKQIPQRKEATRSVRRRSAVQAARRVREEDMNSDAPQPTQTETPKTTPVKDKQLIEVDGRDAINVTADPVNEQHAQDVGVVAPDSVFACFNGKTRAYYPARCLGQSADGHRYTVQWAGYDPDEVDAYGVKSLDLRIGDLVKVDMKGVPKVSHVVRGFKDRLNASQLPAITTDQRGFSTLIVAAKKRKSLPADVSTENDKEVPVSAIYLDNNMWQQMKDRNYEHRPAEERVELGYATPTEQSTPTTPTSRHRRQTFTLAVAKNVSTSSGIFAGCTFAISYDDGPRRAGLVDMMRDNGATMINESFSELFEADSMQPKAHFTTTGFTALIADKHSRKPKYLQALALGLPCLSGKWVESCVSENKLVNWRRYLLAAGECDELEGAIASRNIPHIPPSEVRLVDMIDSRPLFLKEGRIIMVVGRGKAELRMQNYLFFVRAMGAATIEEVPDIKSANALLEKDDGYDIVYVDDRDLETTRSLLSGEGSGRKAKKRHAANWKVLGTQAIVQSLIFGARTD